MKQYEGALRLLGCILADNAEDFYRFYPGKNRKRKKGKDDYYNRMLGADTEKLKELRRRKADYMLEYRRKKEK